MKNNYKTLVHEYIANFDINFIFNKIQNTRNQIYFIGGSSRAIILQDFKSHDIDIVVPKITNDTIELLKKDFSISLNNHYKSLSFKYNNLDIQISSFRKDINHYGRQAKVELADTIEIDAIRRDLTFNSIYINLLGEISDFYLGELDLLNSTLRFIGNPTEQIQEDYLRAIRYIRFLSLFEKPTSLQEDVDAIKMLSKNITDFVKPDKIRQEISKISQMSHPKNSFNFIKENRELLFLKDFLN